MTEYQLLLCAEVFFAGLTNMTTDTHTDRQTDDATLCAATGRYRWM